MPQRFERIQSFSDPPVKRCPACYRRKVERPLSSPAPDQAEGGKGKEKKDAGNEAVDSKGPRADNPPGGPPGGPEDPQEGLSRPLRWPPADPLGLGAPEPYRSTATPLPDDFSTNLRFNFKYRPGSDLYVVYNERRDTEGRPSDLVDRALTVKWTYLFAF